MDENIFSCFQRMTWYVGDSFPRKPFRYSALQSDAMLLDPAIREWVQKLDLLHLYHLDRLCGNSIVSISQVIFGAGETKPYDAPLFFLVPKKMPTEEEIRSLLDHLAMSYPNAAELIDFNSLTGDIVEARVNFQKNQNFIPTERLKRFEMLQSAVQQAIQKHTEEGENNGEMFLNSFALGSVDHGEEDALAYLRMKGKECDKAVTEVLSRWQAFKKEIADNVQKLRGIFVIGGNGSIKYAAVLRLMQWAKVLRYKKFWAVSDDFYETLLPSPGQDFLAAFPLFRSDLFIDMMKSRLEFLLSKWQEKLLQRLHRGSRPESNAEDNIGDGDDDFNIMAAAASFVFGHCRIKGADVDKDFIDEVTTFLVDKQQPWGSWNPKETDKYSENGIILDAMVIHALGLAQRYDWERAAKLAVKWLWEQRQPYGCWGTSSPTYTTVLVLDAMELAIRGTQVTFKVKSPSVDETYVELNMQTRILTIGDQRFQPSGLAWQLLETLADLQEDGSGLPRMKDGQDWKNAVDLLRNLIGKDSIRKVIKFHKGVYSLSPTVKIPGRSQVGVPHLRIRPPSLSTQDDEIDEN